MYVAHLYISSMDTGTYYDALEVPAASSIDVVKKSYISLVKKYHPDKAEGDEAKQDEYNERLLKIMEAWEFLSDPEKKAEYDAELLEERKSGVAVESGSGVRGKKMSGMAKKSGDIETDYPISMALAAYGKGKIPMRVAGEHVAVKVYPGVRRYRIEGRGVPAEGGKSRGDLYVNLKVIPEERWEIDEKTNNLICRMQIPAKVAEKGGQYPLQLLINRVIKVSIPAGVKTGDRFMPIEGKGLGVMSPKKRGNIVIVAEIAEKKGLFGFFKK